MIYKTSELAGSLLDAAVAKALYGDKAKETLEILSSGLTADGFLPSSNWAHGGPIIDREKITVFHDAWWEAGLNAEVSCSYGAASLDLDFKARGDTALVAAMRCFVSAKLGAEVDL